jgi:hypothetical protein
VIDKKSICIGAKQHCAFAMAKTVIEEELPADGLVVVVVYNQRALVNHMNHWGRNHNLTFANEVLGKASLSGMRQQTLSC